ncbi:MAG: ARMT1-like domain-containing protein [Candidatus Thermoplasmatota archaeon]|jgi:uncharacterized protein with ATP-grasp and redox domains|nr:ARMT1-like domain-containing protein [Candidatus Thermoplasmatota archaeon]
MKIHTECVPCLLRRIIFEVDQSTTDKDVKNKAIKNACKVLSEQFDLNSCSATIATKVHKIVYETLGEKDPYKNLKKQSNKVAESLVPKVEEFLTYSDDPLRIIIICSIVGNIMDFGIEGVSTNPKSLAEVFEDLFVDDLGYDETYDLKKILKDSKKVVLFTDNCGEIVFDKILCREIKKFNPNIFLTVVVKGEPIISDATLEDIKDLNFEEVVDEVLTTGCFAIGLDFEKIPLELKKALDQADLIICKGMANYEAFSETKYHPVAYLLRTKCSPIASSMKLPLNISAVKLYK